MSATSDAVRIVVCGLVDQPEAVSVHEHSGGRRCVLEVRVAPDDMGAVIGRGGRTADALRRLLRSRSESHDEIYDLKIRELEPR